MGLFDMFKSDAGATMTPHMAFVVSLYYIMAADGAFENEEIGVLLTVLGGEKQGNVIGVGAQNKALLDASIKYAKGHSVEQFLAEATPLLTDAQKMCILINLVDVSLADGEADPSEQVIFDKILRSFGISEERFRPFFEVVVLKNDRTVFTNPNNPKNAPGFQVRLTT
ncbi:MAG: TerB family tellurite resistance protein [Candidatus Competibacterales bacterium]